MVIRTTMMAIERLRWYLGRFEALLDLQALLAVVLTLRVVPIGSIRMQGIPAMLAKCTAT